MAGANLHTFTVTSDQLGWIHNSLTLMRQAAIKNKLQLTVDKVEEVMDALKVDA